MEYSNIIAKFIAEKDYADIEKMEEEGVGFKALENFAIENNLETKEKINVEEEWARIYFYKDGRKLSKAQLNKICKTYAIQEAPVATQEKVHTGFSYPYTGSMQKIKEHDGEMYLIELSYQGYIWGFGGELTVRQYPESGIRNLSHPLYRTDFKKVKDGMSRDTSNFTKCLNKFLKVSENVGDYIAGEKL